MADDLPKFPEDVPLDIVIPAALARIATLAIEHHEATNALDKARSLLNDANALCKDCDGNLSIQIEREQAAADALVDALDLRCPGRGHPFRSPHRLNARDLTARQCTKCGAKIVVEGEGQ